MFVNTGDFSQGISAHYKNKSRGDKTNNLKTKEIHFTLKVDFGTLFYVNL